MSSPGVAEGCEVGQRLQLWASYLVVVADQLSALHSRDARQVESLNRERERLEAELGSGREEAPSEAAPPRLLEALEVGLAEVARRSETSRQVEEGWRQLSEAAIRSAHTMPPQRRRAGRYSPPGVPGERLDSCL
jgi:hypothetical protein